MLSRLYRNHEYSDSHYFGKNIQLVVDFRYTNQNLCN